MHRWHFVTFGLACGQMPLIRELIVYREYVQPLDPSPVEVLILGELVVRKNGKDVTGLPRALAETLTLLAAQRRPVLAREIMSAHSLRPSRDAFDQHITRLKNRFSLPIVSEGPRGATAYKLDPAKCQVDAVRFVQGVEDRQDIDDLLRLWRGPAPQAVLNSSGVQDALARLIGRISDLPEGEQAALAELPGSRRCSPTIVNWTRSGRPARAANLGS